MWGARHLRCREIQPAGLCCIPHKEFRVQCGPPMRAETRGLGVGFFVDIMPTPYDNSNSNSSRPKPAIRLLSALIIESAESRFVHCSSRTFSSTVSRAISL